MDNNLQNNRNLARSPNIYLDNEYSDWILELKQRYKNAQLKTAVKVNSELLLFNWLLGKDLVSRKFEEKWGDGIVEQISNDLQTAFPDAKGFSSRNLWFMKQWYLFYSSDKDASLLITKLEKQIDSGSSKLNHIGSLMEEQKLKQVVSEMKFPSLFSFVPWGHHILIVQKCKTVKEALYYIKRTIAENMSRSSLIACINGDAFHSQGEAETNFESVLPEQQGVMAKELLKQNYDLGFIELVKEYNEEDFEEAIEKRITVFLLELGSGWAFVGRQKEIVIAGKTRRIDLLFYQIFLKCYVVIELKVKSFEPEFAGKLNFYVNAVDDCIRNESDNPTIGLLICKDMNRTDVRLSFQGITTPLGVATYDNVRIKEISEKIPTADQIEFQIELAEEEYKMRRDKNANRSGNHINGI